MIRTGALRKSYGRIQAVDGIDLDVRRGDVYGFLGANGSGKTTTIRMLLGLVLATSGDIEVLDAVMPKDARSVLPRVGALVEGPAAHPHLSGRRNLALLDSAGPGGDRRTRRERIEESLARVGLDGVDRRPVKAYSLGMRQRLGLAAALLRAPDLLILDEPTNGLDPQGIREIRTLLRELNAEGTTIFLSSHLLSEVEAVCTRIGVLDRGRLVLQEQLADLTAPTGRTVVSTTDPERACHVLGDLVEERSGSTLVVHGADRVGLNARLVEAGVGVAELGPERRSLEQVVLAATEPGNDRVSAPRPEAEQPAVAPR